MKILQAGALAVWNTWVAGFAVRPGAYSTRLADELND